MATFFIIKCIKCNSEIGVHEGDFDVDCDCGITFKGHIEVVEEEK